MALWRAGRSEELAEYVAGFRAAAESGDWRAANQLINIYVELGDRAGAVDVIERSGFTEDSMCSPFSLLPIRSDPVNDARLAAILKANAAKR